MFIYDARTRLASGFKTSAKADKTRLGTRSKGHRSRRLTNTMQNAGSANKLFSSNSTLTGGPGSSYGAASSTATNSNASAARAFLNNAGKRSKRLFTGAGNSSKARARAVESHVYDCPTP